MGGYYQEVTRIRDGAKKIDNVTKFAWDDDDYETVKEWHEYTEEEQQRIDDAEEARQREDDITALLSETPSAIAELGGMASSNETTIDELMNAVTELANMITEKE